MGAFSGSFGMMGYPHDSQALANQVAPSPSRSGTTSTNSHQRIAPRPPSTLDFQDQVRYGHVGQSSTATDGFNFNEPYAHNVMPLTPSGLSSPSQPPHGGGFRWDNGRPQNVAEPLTPGSLPFAPSARGSGQTVIDAHDGILRQPYDPDILVEDGVVDHEMADSDGEVDERAAGFEMENMDPGESMRKRSTFGALIDGRLVPHNEIHETRMRTFSAYARGTTLATYVPASGHVLPTDPQTMAVFRHFVFVTGPSMSLYERHPFDHSKVSPEQLVPQVNQNIWTCKWTREHD